MARFRLHKLLPNYFADTPKHVILWDESRWVQLLQSLHFQRVKKRALKHRNAPVKIAMGSLLRLVTSHPTVAPDDNVLFQAQAYFKAQVCVCTHASAHALLRCDAHP